MRKATYWLLGVVCCLTAACARPSAEEQATQAALECYRRLAGGDTTVLLSARLGADSLPADYRRQLDSTLVRYMRDIQQKHGGLHGVSVSGNPARRDSLRGADGHWQQVVYSFLLLHFNDSTHEEIAVPMVEHHGEWRLR